MRLSLVFLACLLVVPIRASCAEVVTLRAHPGEYFVKTLVEPASTSKLSLSVRITKFAGTREWPSAAYVGFYEGPDRKQSVQFLIIRNRESDPYVVAGYRVIENGREQQVESLANLPLDHEAQVDMSFLNGVVTLRLNGGALRTVNTKLRTVAPYLAVSSSTGEFKIEP